MARSKIEATADTFTAEVMEDEKTVEKETEVENAMEKKVESTKGINSLVSMARDIWWNAVYGLTFLNPSTTCWRCLRSRFRWPSE